MGKDFAMAGLKWRGGGGGGGENYNYYNENGSEEDQFINHTKSF